MKKRVKEKRKVAGIIKNSLIIGILLLVVLIVLEIGLYVSKPAKEIPTGGRGALGTAGVFTRDMGERIIGVKGAGIEGNVSYYPKNCSNESLKETWNYIFKESSDNMRIVAEEDCSFYFLYKVKNDDVVYVIFGMNYDNGYDEGSMLYSAYANYTSEIINLTNNFSEIYYKEIKPDGGLIEYLIEELIMVYYSDYYIEGPRDINNSDAANMEFSNIYKIKNGSWYDSGEGYLFNDSGGGGIYKAATIDVYFQALQIINPINLTQIKDIGDIEFYGKDDYYDYINLRDYFENIGINYDNNLSFSYSLSNVSAFTVYKGGDNYLNFYLNISTPRETLMNITIGYTGLQNVTSNNFKVVAYACYDSDGGVNDTSNGYAYNSTSLYADTCIDNMTLKEYYCDNDSVANITLICSSENYCNQRACRKKINLTQIKDIKDITLYESGSVLYLSDYFNNLGYYDYNLTYSYNISNMSAFSVSMDDYYDHSIYFYLGDLLFGNYVMNITLGYPGMQSVTSNNFNVSVRACYDSDGGWDRYEKGTAKNITINATDYCINNAQGIEHECYYGNVLNESFSCYSRYYCYDGFCNKNDSYYCWDNDGGNNPNEKGVTSNRSYYYSTISNFTDSCYNSTAVLEYYCGSNDTYHNNRVNSSIIDCAAGYSCGDGACVQNSTAPPTTPPDTPGPSNPPPTNQTPNLTITIFRINNPIPAGANVSMSMNRTTLFMISNSIYDSIKWYLDGVVIKNSTNFFEAGNLTAGNHTVKVEIRKGSMMDSRMWLLTVKEEENPDKGWDATVILFWIIIGVALIIGILFAVLIVIQNSSGEEKIVSSKESPVLDLNPVKKQELK